MMVPDNRRSITVVASTENLQVIRDFVGNTVSGIAISEEELNSIIVAVDEVCANLIVHAYPADSRKPIEVHIEVYQDKVAISIIDYATPFDPNSVSLPDLEEYFKMARPGGLGIYFTRSIMDEISYTPAREIGGHNTLVLTKYPARK